MTKKEEITALRGEIRIKERQLYRAEKEMNAWNKGSFKSHSNTKMSKLFVDTSRREIAELAAKLNKLEKKES